MRHDLDIIYQDDDYTWRKRGPYYQFCEVLQEMFDPISFLDIGCIQGFTLEWFLDHGISNVVGIEGSEAPFRHASPRARKCMHKYDLRDPLDLGEKYHLVNCMEMVEHIESEFEDIFLDTVRRHASYWLTFSAARVPDHAEGTERQSHWNLKPYEYWEKALEQRGFVIRKDLRNDMRKLLKRRRKVYTWWAQNLIVGQAVL